MWSRYDGKIVDGPRLKNGVEAVKIHWAGWNKKYDQWVVTNSNKIRPPGTCAKLIAADQAVHQVEFAAKVAAEADEKQKANARVRKRRLGRDARKAREAREARDARDAQDVKKRSAIPSPAASTGTGTGAGRAAVAAMNVEPTDDDLKRLVTSALSPGQVMPGADSDAGARAVAGLSGVSGLSGGTLFQPMSRAACEHVPSVNALEPPTSTKPQHTPHVGSLGVRRPSKRARCSTSPLVPSAEVPFLDGDSLPDQKRHMLQSAAPNSKRIVSRNLPHNVSHNIDYATPTPSAARQLLDVVARSAHLK